MAAIRSNFFVSITVDVLFYVLVFRQVLFSFDDITMSFSRAITNILQEFKDVFSVKIPGLPP
jgi:hypothetical protein